jgi:pyranose oxidase
VPIPNDPDVLIVGSGPIGSAYARAIYDTGPDTRILMVDVGPKLTDPPGMHVRNIADLRERLTAQVRSQGPSFTEDAVNTAAALIGLPPTGEFARPGTFYVSPERAAARATDTLSVAAISSNVGGMGAHWTCACPPPAGREVTPFLDHDEWEADLARAQELLSVRQDVFPRTAEGEAALRALNAEFDQDFADGRRAAPMPLACRVGPDGERYWVGPDVVLGSLATEPPATFELRPETLCRRLVVEDGRVTGAVLHDMASGTDMTVRAGVVVVACDGLRTPQLLWASGVRPRALGHYLNDHLQFGGPTMLAPEKIEAVAAELDGDYVEARRPSETDPVVGVFWLPFSEAHPFSGQVMHFDMSPVQMVPTSQLDPARTVLVGYFVPKDIRFEDCVEFSDDETDVYGMPKMRITYRLTEADHQAIEAARKLHARAAAALGGFAPGSEPHMLPPGTSLHYQGTVRMGAQDDGESVCDSDCRVWGVENLFVGGNGVIPTPTAGNPTLTSVAHALRAARAVVAALP